jgi:hypothetical protein
VTARHCALERGRYGCIPGLGNGTKGLEPNTFQSYAPSRDNSDPKLLAVGAALTMARCMMNAPDCPGGPRYRDIRLARAHISRVNEPMYCLDVTIGRCAERDGSVATRAALNVYVALARGDLICGGGVR